MKQFSYIRRNFKTTKPILIILSPLPKLIEAKLKAISFMRIDPVAKENFAVKHTQCILIYIHTYICPHQTENLFLFEVV